MVALVILPAFNERLTATARRLYEFYGPWDFLRLGLRYAGAKLADRVNRLRPLTRPYSAEDVARRHGIPVHRPAKINAPDFVRVLAEDLRPDLLVSIAASQILRQRVLDVARLGCINMHAAPGHPDAVLQVGGRKVRRRIRPAHVRVGISLLIQFTQSGFR